MLEAYFTRTKSTTAVKIRQKNWEFLC